MATALENLQTNDVSAIPFDGPEPGGSLAQSSPPAGYLAVKAAIEFCAAAVLLVLCGPIILICAALVRLTSRGPAFYSQVRLGLGGRPYWIFKLRTMYHQCEAKSGAAWSQVGDPRVTPLGRFLRSTHLDELPQLWNVLRGEMSLIGPRPERPEFVPSLARAIPLYEARMLVRPGVTGLAQVQLPPDSDLDSVRTKLTYDLYYVGKASLWLDVRIVLATLLKVIGATFGMLRKAFHFPTRDAVCGYYQELNERQLVEPQPQPQPLPRLVTGG